jgi:hypothetical protein
MAKSPKIAIAQVAGSGRTIVTGGGVSGTDGGTGVPGGTGVSGGGGGPTTIGGAPGPVGGRIGAEGGEPGTRPEGMLPGKNAEGGGPKIRSTGWVSYCGGTMGIDATASEAKAKTGLSGLGGMTWGRSRTVESTRSCGPLIEINTRGPRPPGERSAKRVRGSSNAAAISAMPTLLKAGSQYWTTPTKTRPASTDASNRARFHILLPLEGMGLSWGRPLTRPERNFARKKPVPKMFPTPFQAFFCRSSANVVLSLSVVNLCTGHH